MSAYVLRPYHTPMFALSSMCMHCADALLGGADALLGGADALLEPFRSDRVQAKAAVMSKRAPAPKIICMRRGIAHYMPSTHLRISIVGLPVLVHQTLCKGSPSRSWPQGWTHTCTPIHLHPSTPPTVGKLPRTATPHSARTQSRAVRLSIALGVKSARHSREAACMCACLAAGNRPEAAAPAATSYYECK